LRRATEARGVIEGRDIRRRGDSPDAWHGRQPGHDGILGRDARHPVVRGREFVIEDRDQALQWPERLGDRGGEVQRRHPDEKTAGTAAPHPEPGSADDRPRQRDRAGPTVREFATDIEVHLHCALRRGSPMRRAITAPLTRLRQRDYIAPIGLDASAALAVHGRERRIGHNHLVAEGLQVLRHPLALGRRLEQNPHRASPFEQGREPLAGRRDASVDRLTALRDDPDLTFLLVEIDGTILHGWSSPSMRLESACQ
jgi:hypothetical protein